MTSIEEQVKNISLKAEDIKITIYQTLHREYEDLLGHKSQHELLKTIKPLIGDINKLNQRFENDLEPKVKAATTQHKDLVDEFNKTSLVTHFLQKICLCHSELIACKSCEGNQFVKSATHLKIVKKELESLDSPICDIKIFKVVRNEYINQQTRVTNSLNNVWSSIITWTMSPNLSWDSLDGHVKTSLKIDRKCLSGTNGAAPVISDILHAMHTLQSLHPKLKNFSQKLYTYLFKPLIKFQSLAPVIEEKDNCFTLKITKKKVHSEKLTKATSSVLLYKKILDIVQFVKKSLFKDFEEVQDLTPVKTIGGFIWKDLSEYIIKDYLAASVPNSNSQMEKYESTIEETIQFELDLKAEGFIPEEEEILSKYIKDVNIHFANKVCQDILSEARYIILTEMHNTVEVGVMDDRAAIVIPSAQSQNKEGEILSKKIKNILKGLEAVEDDFLQVNTFAFPNCYISDSVQKLMDFVYRTMIQATESPYPMACQMVYSCRDVFDLYVNVVPTYHQDNLKLPQLAALHYNNCMYLAHHCITLGHQFQNSLPGQLNSPATTFVDLVPVLRKSGTDCFLEQIRSQQKELLSLLEPCEQFTQVATVNGSETIKRSFNQIIHHLTRVAKQWDKILPATNFKKSLSVLINIVIDSCISSVLKMEDISADEAGQMFTLFSYLVDRIPEIVRDTAVFKAEEYVLNEAVRSYNKFNFVIKILAASLQEIIDLWSNGQEGSLATAMTENEVRTLIRALFQNTDRRSQALMKIKHTQSSNN